MENFHGYSAGMAATSLSRAVLRAHASCQEHREGIRAAAYSCILVIFSKDKVSDERKCPARCATNSRGEITRRLKVAFGRNPLSQLSIAPSPICTFVSKVHSRRWSFFVQHRVFPMGKGRVGQVLGAKIR